MHEAKLRLFIGKIILTTLLVGCNPPGEATPEKDQVVEPNETARQTETLSDKSNSADISQEVSAKEVCDQIKTFDQQAIQKTLDELAKTDQKQASAAKSLLKEGKGEGFVYYFEINQIIEIGNGIKLHLQCAKYQVTPNQRGAKEFNLALFSRRRNFDDHFALPVLTIYGPRGFKSDQLPEEAETFELEYEEDPDFSYENAQFFDGERKVQYYGNGNVAFNKIPASNQNAADIAIDLTFRPDESTAADGFIRFAVDIDISGNGQVLTFDFLD